MSIRISHEGRRGCGFRKPGAMYFVSDGLAAPCGVFPIPLSVCPTCHGGIKPTRGFTWIDFQAIRGNAEDCAADARWCAHCPANSVRKCGLLWIGETYYKTPAIFAKEAVEMGISRRCAQIPNGFIIGRTWIALAHRKAVSSSDVLGLLLQGKTEPKRSAGIFRLFCPERIEYIVKAGDSKKKLEGLEKRGLSLVKIAGEEEL